MSTRGHVVAVTCLALEARIALGPGVAVICNHASELVASLEAAAKRGAAGIISFGIAGGLAPDLNAGDWVVGSGARTWRSKPVSRGENHMPTWTRKHVAVDDPTRSIESLMRGARLKRPAGFAQAAASCAFWAL